ncbi:hypothetical protein DRO61_04630 [Candidatus Bathyarchaeota archaeon]|nr:MAG: hypothetical protein DRO61_04630 [Candidatus Bathyarchaeota archaeon]
MDIAAFQKNHRIWPKAQLIFWAILIYRVTEWAMTQPDLSNAQAAIVSTVYMAGAAYGKFYGETDPSNKPIVAVQNDSIP